MARDRAPKVPSGISPRSSRLWRAVVAEYELSDAELEVLRSACEQLDRADEAAAILKRHPLVVVDRYGNPRAHPAIEVERKARGVIRQSRAATRRGSR